MALLTSGCGQIVSDPELTQEEQLAARGQQLRKELDELLENSDTETYCVKTYPQVRETGRQMLAVMLEMEPLLDEPADAPLLRALKTGKKEISQQLRLAKALCALEARVK